MHIQVPAAYQEMATRATEDISTELNVRHEGTYEIIEIVGPLAFGWVAEELGREVRKMLAQGEKNLVLDLDLVPYIDSTGIGALASALNAVRGVKGKMVLLSVHPRILSVLSRLRLTQFFTFSQDRTLAFTKE